MLTRLKRRWNVTGLQLALIILAFALGGSLCGYTGRKIVALFFIDVVALKVLLYIVLITLLWPFSVLVVSIPLGQFSFFRNYIKKIGRRIFGIGRKEKGYTPQNSRSMEHGGQNPHPKTTNMKPQTTHIAIFASGAGSNAHAIINYFRNSSVVKVALIVSNKPEAGVLKIAEKENIPSLLIEKERFFRGDAYMNELKEKKIDFIVLAGFLWKVPSMLIKVYPHKIVNIHPALLPKYGGKGMYGSRVHEAVIANKEKESGITIHYVDELYDHGSIIF
ncbi:MAG TPA: formyltransferase family protein, partial [Chitinophagaceae bacterium]|nr:formyltransferase family protein [Chitinophagaceae bacterium]